MKNILTSKTVILNFVSFVLFVLALPQFNSLVPISVLPYIALANAILNGILRIFFTAQPLTQFAASHQGPTS